MHYINKIELNVHFSFFCDWSVNTKMRFLDRFLSVLYTSHTVPTSSQKIQMGCSSENGFALSSNDNRSKASERRQLCPSSANRKSMTKLFISAVQPFHHIHIYFCHCLLFTIWPVASFYGMLDKRPRGLRLNN